MQRLTIKGRLRRQAEGDKMKEVGSGEVRLEKLAGKVG